MEVFINSPQNPPGAAARARLPPLIQAPAAPHDHIWCLVENNIPHGNRFFSCSTTPHRYLFLFIYSPPPQLHLPEGSKRNEVTALQLQGLRALQGGSYGQVIFPIMRIITFFIPPSDQ